MPDINQIEALIARVEAATEGSDQIDYDIHRAVFPHQFRHGGAKTHDDWATYDCPGFGPVLHGPQGAYTASLDAIVGLIERELPGWAWKVTRDYARGNYCVVLRDAPSLDIVAPAWVQTSPTPALALCLAFLRAMHSKEQL